jgi:hypothetical protein
MGMQKSKARLRIVGREEPNCRPPGLEQNILNKPYYNVTPSCIRYIVTPHTTLLDSLDVYNALIVVKAIAKCPPY